MFDGTTVEIDNRTPSEVAAELWDRRRPYVELATNGQRVILFNPAAVAYVEPIGEPQVVNLQEHVGS
jgi:hypothetical protein